MSNEKAIRLFPRVPFFPGVPQEELDQELSRDWVLWFASIIYAVPIIKFYTVTFNPASIGPNTTAEQTVTVTGLVTTDVVTVNKPSLTAGIGLAGARVSAINTLALTFVNATAGAIDPGSEVYTVVAIRQ